MAKSMSIDKLMKLESDIDETLAFKLTEHRARQSHQRASCDRCRAFDRHSQREQAPTDDSKRPQGPARTEVHPRTCFKLRGHVVSSFGNGAWNRSPLNRPSMRAECFPLYVLCNVYHGSLLFISSLFISSQRLANDISAGRETQTSPK